MGSDKQLGYVLRIGIMFASAAQQVRKALGRHRLATLAAGAAAVTVSALAANANCISISLDDAATASLTKSLAEALGIQQAPAVDVKAVLAKLSDDEIYAELKRRLTPPPMNTAFVFAKPHANTPAVLEVIKGKFAEKGIKILKEGEVTGEEIDKNGYIDQHYYAIVSRNRNPHTASLAARLARHFTSWLPARIPWRRPKSRL